MPPFHEYHDCETLFVRMLCEGSASACRTFRTFLYFISKTNGSKTTFKLMERVHSRGGLQEDGLVGMSSYRQDTRLYQEGYTFYDGLIWRSIVAVTHSPQHFRKVRSCPFNIACHEFFLLNWLIFFQQINSHPRDTVWHFTFDFFLLLYMWGTVFEWFVECVHRYAKCHTGFYY